MTFRIGRASLVPMWHPRPEVAAAAAARFGTPLYLYDFARAQARVRALRAATEGELSIWYALKANANRALLEALVETVDGADVASSGELAQALSAGFVASQVGFTGPGKTREALEAAIAAGVCISVESLAELEDVARIAAGRRPRVLLRINPEARVHAFPVATGGVPGPFGIDEGALEGAVRRALELKDDLRCEGVHVHAGSGCASAAAWHRHAVAVLDLAARAISLGLPLSHVNLGGGLAVSGLGVEALGRKLAASVRRFRAAFGAVQVVCEPGRHLVAEAGCFVARVVRRIESRGRVFVVLDGGINNFLFATERFHDGPPPEVLNLTRRGEAESVHLVGPACTPLDSLGRGLEIAAPRQGDLLALGPAGAYGFSASPHLFLGHDAPAEVAVRGDGLECIRARRALSAFD